MKDDYSTLQQLISSGYYDTVNGISDDKLTMLAFSKLQETLTSYGNTLTDNQKVALLGVLTTFTRMAQGRMMGRWAYGLPTGLGKTTSIMSWITAVHELGHDHISALVCASKVEALCDMKRELMKAGVPEEKIGLYHSYNHDETMVELKEGYASLPRTNDHHEKQFLLTTHTRVRGGGTSTETFNTYQGKKRDVLIWDESLFISDNYTKDLHLLRAELAYLKEMYPSQQKDEAVSYLSGCLSIVNDELGGQSNGAVPQTLRMPPLLAEKKEQYRILLDSYKDRKPVNLINFLDIVPNDLRVLLTQRPGLISFEIVVPEELDKIVILDASHPIRKLIAMDSTIKTGLNPNAKLVSYQNVAINWLKEYSGRDSMTRHFSRKAEDNLICKEIVETIKSNIPDEEGVIIFAFKGRKEEVDFIKAIKEALTKQGVEVDLILPNGKPKFVFLTWGNETSLSQHSYCSNVIFAGVLHRNPIELAGAISGQHDSLLMGIDHKTIQDVQDSEISHCLYQAMSRGTCRIFHGDVTKPMNVWLIHKWESTKDLLGKVMPDAQWKPWIPKYLVSMKKQDKAARIIADYLIELEETLQDEFMETGEIKISTRKIKSDLNGKLEDLPDRTSTNSLPRVLEILQDRGWEKTGRSLVRTSAKAWGF